MGICKAHSISTGSSLDCANIELTKFVSTASVSNTFAYTSPIMSSKLDVSSKQSSSASNSGKSESSCERRRQDCSQSPSSFSPSY